MENLHTQQQQHIGHATTPLVTKALRRQAGNRASRSALSWAGCNLVLAILCYLEIAFHTIGHFFEVHHPSVWYVACVLAALFTINTLVDLGRYLLPTIRRSRDPIQLSPKEKVLLGVRDKDVGFKMRSRRISSAPSNLNAYNNTGSPTIQPPSTYLYPSSSVSTPSASFHGTPPSAAHRLSHHNSPVFNNASFNASQGSPYVTPQQSMTSMHTTPGVTPRQSPVTPSSLYRDTTNSGMLLRSRGQSSPLQSSPSTVFSDAVITDKNALNSYLKSHEEKERRHQLGSSESSPSGSPSFWSFNRSASDFTPLLRKFQYQLASRSPQSPARNDPDDPDYPATIGADEVWGRSGIVRDELEGWIASLRMYISQTILRPLMKAIDEVNSALIREGRAELQIGEVSLSSLRQLASTRSQCVQTLTMVMPYLDVHSNQEYVVQRLRELSKGGCMSDFRWNGGGEFKGRKWESDLPTDAAMIMHMFCSYLDSRLPAHPKYPDGKTFASQHFMKVPDKPDLKKKENLLLFQTKINPPHYKVIIGDDTWDLPKGRSNMFQVILLFLHHIKSKEYGMLGRVNLGPSGVNILWVIDRLHKFPQTEQWYKD